MHCHRRSLSLQMLRSLRKDLAPQCLAVLQMQSLVQLHLILRVQKEELQQSPKALEGLLGLS